MMLTPPVTFDAVYYHLPLVQTYAESQRLALVPAITQSMYPQAGELLLTLGYVLGGMPAAQILPALIGVIYLWLTYRLGRCCRLGHSAALLGTAIAAAFPFLHWSFSVPKNDGLLALFQLSSLYCLLQWHAGRGSRWILFSAFLLGHGFGVKHTALFFTAGLAPLLTLAVWRSARRLRLAAASALLFILAGFYWHIDLWMRTGSPVFIGDHGRRSRSRAQRTLDVAAIPWILHFEGQRRFESPSPSPAGVIFLLLTPALLWLPRPRRWSPPAKVCAFAAGACLVPWLVAVPMLRYAIPAFSIVALGLGAAVVAAGRQAGRLPRRVWVAAAGYGFLFSLPVMMTFEVNSLQVAFLMRRVNEREYLEQAIPATQPLFRLRMKEPDARVFGVENCSRLYAPRPFSFACTLCTSDGSCGFDETIPRLFDYVIVPDRPDRADWARGILELPGSALVSRQAGFATFRTGAR
jgi:hypothetical protein